MKALGNVSPEHYDYMLKRQMASLRIFSFQHRADEYYTLLLKRLNQLPDFRKCWKATKYESSDFQIGGPFFINQWGGLHVVAFIIPFYTKHGTLRLTTFCSASIETSEKYQTILEKRGQAVVKISKWPEKPPYK